jgi:hypothetical protein
MAVTSTMSTLLDLLALVLVAAAVLTLPAIGLVFTVGRRPAARRMPAGARIVTYRLMVAAAGIGLVSVCIGLLIGRDAADSVLAGVVLAVAVLVWQPLRRQFAGRGVLAWALPVVAAAAFLGFVLIWTLTAELSPLGLLAGLVVWMIEAVILGIGLANLWQLVDKRTRRAPPPAADPLQPGGSGRRPLVSYVRHGSMLAVAGVVGAVVFLAPFTPKPTPGDLGNYADGSSSPPDAKVAARDAETADELSRVGLDASATPIQPTRPTRTQPSDASRSRETPRSVQPTTPTHEAPGRPTDKPTPPGHTKVPPGHSDDHPKHQDEQDDQDDQDG